MRSSSGSHFIALDHIRALAAFIVFTWHFLHVAGLNGAAISVGYPVPFDYVPVLFPLAILDEGHTGVALFMVLSGYLFSKLIGNRSINYKAFIWNRCLRLLPLLLLVVFLVGIRDISQGLEPLRYAYRIIMGLVLPTLPNGGWSITVEFQFYLALPLLLLLLRKHLALLVSILFLIIVGRVLLWSISGTVQYASYLTLFGRIDQFVLGMIAFRVRSLLAGRHLFFGLVFVIFCILYWQFDRSGGYYHGPEYPSPRVIWVFLPLIEAVAYSVFVAWYDSSFTPPPTGISGSISRLGEYSYSIYLLHFFLVFDVSVFMHEHIMDISNFYAACLLAALFFILMMPVGYLSYTYIESPFLELRKPYILGDKALTDTKFAHQNAAVEERVR